MFHIVDDNLIGGRNTAKIVRLFDAQSMLFTSALDYLAYVKSPEYRQPTAVFTDIFMYGMDGYEMIEEILAIHPDQKFVVISGRPYVNHPCKNRACFYLSKPFYIRDIEKIIHKMRRCEKEGSSPDIECAGSGDCSEFSISNWRCPQLENLKAHARQNAAGTGQKG